MLVNKKIQDALAGPILFLQNQPFLSAQKAIVRTRLEEDMPGVKVQFASSSDEVPESPFPIVIAPTLQWLPEALAKISDLRWVHFLSSGVDRIWEMPLDRESFLMSKSSGVHAPQMSEYAIGAMLYFAKSFDVFQDQSREHNWSRFWLDELSERTITILGAGHVGKALAKRAKMFDMRTLAVQRRPQSDPDFDETIEMVRVPDILPETDYLVVCLPLTDRTRHFVDGHLLHNIKKGAVLVDISRGGVVVENDVVDALDRGYLRGAALDVFETEPLPKSSRLWGRHDILLTPHVSGTSPHYLNRALNVFLANVARLRSSNELATPVDPIAGY